jgi:hypothetical protein
MPRKATRISFDSSNLFRLDFGLDMTSKLTVKANKLVRTGKITHPRKNLSKKSGRWRVDGSLQSIYILLET